MAADAQPSSAETASQRRASQRRLLDEHELLSPELALVSPELARRARELLPDYDPNWPHVPRDRAHDAGAASGSRAYTARAKDVLLELGAVAAVRARSAVLVLAAVVFVTTALTLLDRRAAPSVESSTATRSVLSSSVLSERAPVSRAGSAEIRLSWTPSAEATYYNVQFFRGGEKVLDLWPRGSSVRVPVRWRLDGRLRCLAPGVYRWYVRPGLGTRSAGLYGRLLGRGTLVVRPGTTLVSCAGSEG